MEAHRPADEPRLLRLQLLDSHEHRRFHRILHGGEISILKTVVNQLCGLINALIDSMIIIDIALQFIAKLLSIELGILHPAIARRIGLCRCGLLAEVHHVGAADGCQTDEVIHRLRQAVGNGLAELLFQPRFQMVSHIC